MDTALEFYLNGKKQVVRNADPTQTVLQYVRDSGLTGTKLGCQEGGCGACTMTLAAWDSVRGRPKYMAINGCIAPLIIVDGKHLITVEGIGNAKEPHAVQERIAKFHGSQCGFCTPGIVMSLYSLLRDTQGNPSKDQISEAFDGNLCRCTGYKPIIDASNTFSSEFTGCGKVANGDGEFKCCKADGAVGSGGCCKDLANSVDTGRTNGNTGANGAIDTNGTNVINGSHGNNEANGIKKRRLETDFTTGPLKTPNGETLKPYPHSELLFPAALKKYQFGLKTITGADGTVWYRPTTLDDFLRLKTENPSAKIVGGASEFQIEAKIRGDEHKIAIYANEIPELQTFEYVESKGVLFGANLPLSELEHHLEDLIKKIGPEKSQTFAAIVEQLKYFAGRQIRNVATAAGNIATASPISDLNPIFVASNSVLHVVTSAGLQEIPMGSDKEPFFVGYRKTLIPADGVLARIFVPITMAGEIVRCYKQAKRKDDDISIVTGCLRAVADPQGVITHASLAYGGVAPITVLAKTSRKLVGKPVDSALLELAINSLDKEFDLSFDVPGGMAVFRRSLVLSFFYKFFQSLQKGLGIEGYDSEALKDVTRDHPIGERDLTNVNEERILGKNDIHLSAMKQVTGEAQYVDDIPPFHGELQAVQVLSTTASGKILSIDWTPALELEGVEGYIDVNDVAENLWGFPIEEGKDRFFVQEGEVRYVGDCIGLICASTREIAAKAARLVKIKYEEYEPIITIEQAIEKQSFFPLFPVIDNGDVEAGFASAAHVLEGSCRIGAQEHFYLEPQGSIVVPEEGDEYKIYASSQNPNETQLVAAKILGVPASRIVAKVKRMGGGFGGKETRSCHYSSIAAAAAKKFRKPIRLILSRSEDMLQAGQRHPFLMKWKVGLDKDYKFVALHADLYANAGCTLDLTKGVMDRAAFHVDNCYDFKNVHVKAWPCRTNVASNTAFRGFGGPQGMFCTESLIYEVSESLGITPERLREINYYPLKNGVTHFKQNMKDDFTVPLLAEQLLSQVNYDNLRTDVDEFNAKSKWIKRGLAYVPTKFGISFGVLWLNQAGALVHIYEDGSILVAHGGTEMGQGINTKMAMVCASELGVSLDDVFISETSTQTVINASPSAASATSDLNGMAVKNACDQLNKRLKPYRKKYGANAPMSKIAHDAYFDRVNLSANGFYKTPDIGYVPGDPKPKPAFLYFTQGVAVAVVEVNTLTGDWSNLRTDIKMDVGRPLNKAIDYGQIEGAFVQGQGLFTIEESLWLKNGGLFTRGPGFYKIPGFRDIPQHFNVDILQDRPFKHLKTINRSKGIGEPPLFLGSVVLFAIRDAIKAARAARGLVMPKGVESPMTTDKIRTAIGDELADKAQVEVKGVSFTVRS